MGHYLFLKRLAWIHGRHAPPNVELSNRPSPMGPRRSQFPRYVSKTSMYHHFLGWTLANDSFTVLDTFTCKTLGVLWYSEQLDTIVGVTMHLVCQREALLKTFAYFPGPIPPTLGINFFGTLYLLVAARDLLKCFLQRAYLQLAPPPPPPASRIK